MEQEEWAKLLIYGLTVFAGLVMVFQTLSPGAGEEVDGFSNSSLIVGESLNSTSWGESSVRLSGSMQVPEGAELQVGSTVLSPEEEIARVDLVASETGFSRDLVNRSYVFSAEFRSEAPERVLVLGPLGQVDSFLRE